MFHPRFLSSAQCLARGRSSASDCVIVPLICNGLAPPIEMENVQVLALAGCSVLAVVQAVSVLTVPIPFSLVELVQGAWAFVVMSVVAVVTGVP